VRGRAICERRAIPELSPCWSHSNGARRPAGRRGSASTSLAPPQRSSGAEIAATFVAERLARNPELRQYLEGNWLHRAEPIARFDASVLGGVIPPKARATRLGQALSIEYELELVEKQILDCMEGRVSASALFRLCCEFDVQEATLLEAIRSLLRKRLVSIDVPPGEPAAELARTDR
jgi:hypothetical protein